MNDNYLTVTALTRYLKHKIETDSHLKNIWLKGEISNFNHHSRGHMYLTIKDDNARVSAVMFAGNNRSLKFVPENGMNVLIRGNIGVFEPYGQYQLYIQQMEPDGLGSLYLAFEQLKKKLEKQGYFKEERKRTIPPFPKHIGIITSPTGAAVRDIITTIKRRYPIVQSTVIPATVQGSEAAQSIKQAIEFANEQAFFDVLIVGRGGGAIEDLWAFNEEVVADAIFHSDIPIISAVGHETDITISDFVADLRAPTPTGAAELAVPSQMELKESILILRRSLSRSLQIKVKNFESHLQRLKQSYAFRYPEHLLKQKEQELDRLTDRLTNVFTNQMKTKQDELKNINRHLQNQQPKQKLAQSFLELSKLVERMNEYTTLIITNHSKQLLMNMDKLSLLNPLETMKRGYAIPYTEKGKLITSRKQVQKDDNIRIELSDGMIESKVYDVKEQRVNDD